MLWKKEDLYEVDWVKEQTKSALSGLKKEVLYTKNWDEVKFDVDTSLNYLKTLKDKKSYQEVMKQNPWATVMAVQILLKNKWYNIGKIDGILKTQTEATSNTMEAIKKFQRENWLPDDGAPGPDTIKKILAAYENWWWNAWAAKPKPKTPKNPKPATPNKPKTPEKTPASQEITLAELKKYGELYVDKLWKVVDYKFKFNKWVEKTDNRWKYIEIGGKRIYELGNNKNGIYYKVSKGGRYLNFGQFVWGISNWWVCEYFGNSAYIGESKGPRGLWENWDWRWKWVLYDDWNDFESSLGIKLGKSVMYEWEWKKGFLTWKWTASLKDWTKYVGLWEKGNFHSGVKYAKDGKTVLGKWVNWKKVQ